ncbi:MAG: hypothetical protein WD534_00160 [Phycisphaeraceae bacterium]
MSAKYERVKQADLSLPAPLRWLTRAFSSITLSVILLTGVALYGVAATIPFFYLALAGAYLLVAVVAMGLPAVASWVVLRHLTVLPWYGRVAICLALLAVGMAVGVSGGYTAYEQLAAVPGLVAHRATVIYRLPGLEMTELEFYAWWPMKVILFLFVLNMVWATVRRIEFKFANLGVLTVHTGIVVIALGAMFYGRFKVEGDTILWRRDLGGTFEHVFYDAHEPALYITVDGRQTMAPLPELPRYNDYALGELDIDLSDHPAVRELLGPGVRVSIPGFEPYGDLEPSWRPIRDRADLAAATTTSPAVRLALGTADGPSATQQVTLAADSPADRVLEQSIYTVEYLVAPSAQRIEDLTADVDGRHGLIIELPEHDFRRVYNNVEPGQTITLDELGYTFTVRDLGDYGMPFVTPGYENARDTRALVDIATPGGERFTRLAMHRYPERSQDFVPTDDPAAPPIGQRRDPDPAVRIVYLDNTRVHYHLIADGPNAEELSLIVRLPGLPTETATLPERRVPLPRRVGPLNWLYIEDVLPAAGRILEPVPTPRAERDAAEEGTYLRSLLPVLIEVDRPAEDGGPWSRLVWLRHMRYPKYPDQVHRPVIVDLPEEQQVQLAFSRRRYELPFAMALEHFEMTPYPGSQIPQDFTAELLLADRNADGLIHDQPERHRVHMNHPINYRTNAAIGGPMWPALKRVKISQTGWDPPQAQDPAAEARDAQGRFVNQQRFTIVGIGNNVGIHIVALGAVLVAAGIPWAFYVKPWLVHREKRRLQRELAERDRPRPPTPGANGSPRERDREPTAV